MNDRGTPAIGTPNNIKDPTSGKMPATEKDDGTNSKGGDIGDKNDYSNYLIRDNCLHQGRNQEHQ
jgi:hypothetical protein